MPSWEHASSCLEKGKSRVSREIKTESSGEPSGEFRLTILAHARGRSRRWGGRGGFGGRRHG